MNVLIICKKSDFKNYEAVVKTAPNAKVLGAVNVVNDDLIDNIGLKYNPHIIIYDTDVVAKNCDIYTVINLIADKYPHIPFIVFTSEDDNKNYKTPYIIKGQVLSIDFIDTIKKAYADYNNTSRMNNSIEVSVITEKLTNNTILEDEKVPDEDFDVVKVDNLSIKHKKFYKKHLFIFIISVGFIVLIISLLIFKSLFDNNSSSTALNVNISNNNISTPDEVSSFSENVDIDEENESAPEFAVAQTIPNSSQIANSEIEKTTKSPQKNNVGNSSSSSSTSENISKNPTTSTNKQANTNNNSGSTNKQTNINNNNNNTTTNSKTNTNNNQTPANNNNSKIEQQKSVNNVNVSNVSITYTSYSLYVGDSVQLSASVSPSNATNKTVYWTSSDNSVASVSGGTVTAKKSGKAIITARADNKTASCTVTVNPKPQTTIKPTTPKYVITPPQKTISVNSTVTIKITGDIIMCNWKISNPGVADFYETHSAREIVIKAKKVGVTNIIATLPDGTVLKSKITVV